MLHREQFDEIPPRVEYCLTEAAGCGFSKILITCNKPDIASAKVIEKNGGISEKTIPHPGFPDVKRYCINLSGYHTGRVL